MCRKKYITIGIIFAVGALYRLYNITEKGFFYFDEPYYMREAKFYVSVTKNIGFLIDQIVSPTLSTEELKERIEGVPPGFTPKPLHGFLLGIFSVIFGCYDYTGFIFSAILGIITVAFVYWIGTKLFGQTAGLFSAAWLALSAFHIRLSRSAMPEIDSTLLFLAAVYLYYQSTQKRSIRNLIFSGTLFGLSVVCNYRWLWLIGVLWLTELIYCYKERLSLKTGALRFSSLNLSAFFTLFLFEIPYQIIKLFRELPQDVDGRMKTFFEMLIEWYLYHPAKYSQRSAGTPFFPHTYLLDAFWSVEGAIFFLLMVIGISYLLKRPSLKSVLILSFALIPFFVFSLTYRGNRIVALSVSFPFIALTIGAGISSLEMWLREKKEKVADAFLGIAFIGIILFGLFNSHNEVLAKSGYRELAEYIESNRIEKFLATNEAMTRFYINRYSGDALSKGTTLEMLKGYYEKGYRYVVIDVVRIERPSPVIDQLTERYQPIKVIDNDMVNRSNIYYDIIGKSYILGGYEEVQRICDLDKILIYDLKEVFTNG